MVGTSASGKTSMKLSTLVPPAGIWRYLLCLTVEQGFRFVGAVSFEPSRSRASSTALVDEQEGVRQPLVQLAASLPPQQQRMREDDHTLRPDAYLTAEDFAVYEMLKSAGYDGTTFSYQADACCSICQTEPMVAADEDEAEGDNTAEQRKNMDCRFYRHFCGHVVCDRCLPEAQRRGARGQGCAVCRQGVGGDRGAPSSSSVRDQAGRQGPTDTVPEEEEDPMTAGCTSSSTLSCTDGREWDHCRRWKPVPLGGGRPLTQRSVAAWLHELGERKGTAGGGTADLKPLSYAAVEKDMDEWARGWVAFLRNTVSAQEQQERFGKEASLSRIPSAVLFRHRAMLDRVRADGDEVKTLRWALARIVLHVVRKSLPGVVLARRGSTSNSAGASSSSSTFAATSGSTCHARDEESDPQEEQDQQAEEEEQVQEQDAEQHEDVGRRPPSFQTRPQSSAASLRARRHESGQLALLYVDGEPLLVPDAPPQQHPHINYSYHSPCPQLGAAEPGWMRKLRTIFCPILADCTALCCNAWYCVNLVWPASASASICTACSAGGGDFRAAFWGMKICVSGGRGMDFPAGGCCMGYTCGVTGARMVCYGCGACDVENDVEYPVHMSEYAEAAPPEGHRTQRPSLDGFFDEETGLEVAAFTHDAFWEDEPVMDGREFWRQEELPRRTRLALDDGSETGFSFSDLLEQAEGVFLRSSGHGPMRAERVLMEKRTRVLDRFVAKVALKCIVAAADGTLGLGSTEAEEQLRREKLIYPLTRDPQVRNFLHDLQYAFPTADARLWMARNLHQPLSCTRRTNVDADLKWIKSRELLDHLLQTPLSPEKIEHLKPRQWELSNCDCSCGNCYQDLLECPIGHFVNVLYLAMLCTTDLARESLLLGVPPHGDMGRTFLRLVRAVGGLGSILHSGWPLFELWHLIAVITEPIRNRRIKG
eukprot:g253.t1